MRTFIRNPALPWNLNLSEMPFDKPVLVRMKQPSISSFMAIRLIAYPTLLSPVKDHSYEGNGEVYGLDSAEAWLDVDLRRDSIDVDADDVTKSALFHRALK